MVGSAYFIVSQIWKFSWECDLWHGFIPFPKPIAGIWGSDGQLNRDRLNQLLKKSLLHPELKMQIILRRHFDELLKEVHGASGSLDELFRYNSNCTYEGESAITVGWLTDFDTT